MMRICWFVLFLLGAGWLLPARADTSLSLFNSWAGNVNFVGTQKTIRTQSNFGNSCSVTTSAVSATLSGIPSTATVLSAQLYWAGSGNTADNSVTMDGATVTATSARRYTSATVGYNFFSAAADVTTAVQAKRNGTYSFGGLAVTSGSPWCDVSGVVGGYALLVVYSDPSETFRVLNLYEGFQYVQYGSVTLNLSNFKVPTPLGSATGRIAHITWEGDPDLQDSEDLLFNGYELYDTLNPSAGQFNSASNINNDANSYGIDFDAYTVASPVIASGQTTATTVYETGQDLVLLSAEVVAVPNTPTADLSVSLARTGSLVNGQAGSYAITIANSGPNADSGPITVTSTFSSGVAITGASGTGFTCSVSGQVVTCTYSGSLANASTAGPIAVGVTVTGASGSTVTNTTTVTGANFDNISSNNTATDSTTVTSQTGVFTDSICTAGLAFGNASQPCKLWAPSQYAGQSNDFYFTNVNASGVPTASSGNQSLKFGFALVCNNPTTTAGTTATVTPAGSSALTVSSCSPNSGGTPVSYSTGFSFTLANGAATAATKFTFAYKDVGRITLYAKDYNATKFYSSSAFTQRPYLVKLTGVNGATPPASGALTTGSAALVAAGADFTLTAASYASDSSTVTPNFGRETTPHTFALAVTGATAGMTVPALTGSFSITNGIGSGTFQFSEVGNLNITTQVDQSNNYLSAGAPFSTSANMLGRFVPHHFVTTLAGGMTCSTTTTPACTSPITTAAYAQQTLNSATVTAVNAAGTTTVNYANSLGYAHAVNLVAASASNSAGSLASQPGSGTFAATGVTSQQLAASQFSAGVATLASAKYSFSSAYSRAAPTGGRIAPQSVYLVATDAIDSGVTSVGASGYETGTTILSGRLFVPNAYGSDRASVPLPLQAQYAVNTSGTWSVTQIDSTSTVTPSTLQQSCVSGSCKTMSVSNASISFTNGKAPTASPILLAPVTATGQFIVDLYFNSSAWLPSTSGRVAVGTFKSPLIYVREVY